MNTRACIVTTLRNAHEVLDSFITYHLRIGFEHIYLFFDDPTETPNISSYASDKVTLIKNDENLKTLWKQNNGYEYYSKFTSIEVTARQVLNAEIAIKLALAAGYNWILHLDIDELFVVEGGKDVNDHFSEFDKLGVSVVRYINHEGVPQKFNINNYFNEVTLFKKNILMLDESQKKLLTDINGTTKGHFMFYKNGKSAAKLHKGLLPDGVHTFKGKVFQYLNPQAYILHYPCCGFIHFMNKYQSRGKFPDRWFGQFEIAKRFPVHIAARNIVLSNDTEFARRFYKVVFLQQGNGQIEKLVENGIYFRANPISKLQSPLELTRSV